MTVREKEYLCQVRDFEEEQVQLKIVETKASDAELPSKNLSVSGSPEAGEDGIDRAEMCGAWDLCGSPGLHEAVCGEAGCEKRGAKKVERWNTIAASAAKQSGRGIVPEVMSVKTYKEALEMAKRFGCCIGAL